MGTSMRRRERPCYAIADGSVAMIYESPDYGKVLVCSFQHGGKTLYAAYCHLSLVKVQTGIIVKRGQVVGLTGNTGNAVSMKGDGSTFTFRNQDRAKAGARFVGRGSVLIQVFGVCPMKEAIERAGL
ncbi:MAG: M23 family metallopeptidase [Cypionkella sp.]|nr:M23 family metallopeptidase [Cypionkella sp.]